MLGKILNTFGTRLFSAILNLLIAIVISRFLGPDGKGDQSLILATITYILVFANLMGGGAIIFLTPRFHYSIILVPAYLWSLITGALFFVVLKLFDLVDQEFVLHICILSIINAFTSVNASILIGKEKIVTSNIIAMVQPLFIILMLVLQFYFLYSVSIQSYILALYVSFGVALMVSNFYLARYAGRFRWFSFNEIQMVSLQMLKYGILNQLAHLFQLLSFRISFYWLRLVYSEAEVGVYSNGTSLVESIWLISRSISLVQYARISNTKDIVYAQKLTINLTIAALLASSALLVIMVLLPPEFYVFVFGDGFSGVAAVIRSLAPGVLFFNVALIIGHYFSGTGKYHINTIASFAGLVIAVALFYVLIPQMGITGAGWATSISYFFTSVIVFGFFVNESKGKLIEMIPGKSELMILFRDLLHQIKPGKKN